MSEPDAPGEVRGGPSWRHNAPAAALYSSQGLTAPSPGAVPPVAVFGARGASDVDRHYQLRYTRAAVSAIPHLLSSLALLAAAWWALRWSRPIAGAPDPVRSSEWWTNITSVLLPGEDIRLGSYSWSRMWITLALLVLAASAVLAWMGRIGRNLRSSQQPFGPTLALLAFPAWWLLPISIGVTSDSDRSREDLLVRFLLAFAVLFAQFLLLRWPVLNRIWRAGRMPYDLVSIVLWLPMMILWMVFFAANVFTLVTVGERGTVADSSWRPTTAMLDWARGTTRATAIATLVLLIVVTIMQHIGLRRDRAAGEARRERTRSDRLPGLPPGAR